MTHSVDQPKAFSASASVEGHSCGTGATMDITLRVNGTGHQFAVDVRVTVLDVFRQHSGLTDTKKGCDHGQYGAWTVLMDSQTVLSCFRLAVATAHRQLMGRMIRSIG